MIPNVQFSVPEDSNDFILALLSVLEIFIDLGLQFVDYCAMAGISSAGNSIVHPLETGYIGFQVLKNTCTMAQDIC